MLLFISTPQILMNARCQMCALINVLTLLVVLTAPAPRAVTRSLTMDALVKVRRYVLQHSQPSNHFHQ